MSEAPVTEPVVEIPARDADPATEQPIPSAPEVDWKAKSREWERRAKENKAAADKLAEIEEANKTEAQKLAERLAAAEAKAQAAESRALRSDIAREGGVPPELLQGDTEEAMRASLAALLAFKGERRMAMPPAEGVQGNTGRPIGAGTDQLTQDDVKRMYAAKDYDGIEKARTEGRLNAVLGIK